MRELLIGGKNSSVYALLEDGKLVEWITDAGDQEAGELFVGKVERIVPGMSAAFIDIAQEKNGFLPISDDERRSLRCGASILVQIKRQAQGMKGAFLTRNVVLPGRYLLYLPLDREIGVSAKITDQLTRTELKETGNRLSKGECGLVMRTSSAGVPEEWLAEDLEQLKASWESIQKEVRSSSLPRHITGRSCLIRLLDDLLPEPVQGGAGSGELREHFRAVRVVLDQALHIVQMADDPREAGQLALLFFRRMVVAVVLRTHIVLEPVIQFFNFFSV